MPELFCDGLLMFAEGPSTCVHKPVAFVEGAFPVKEDVVALQSNWLTPASAVTAPGITVTVMVESSSHPFNVPNTV